VTNADYALLDLLADAQKTSYEDVIGPGSEFAVEQVDLLVNAGYVRITSAGAMPWKPWLELTGSGKRVLAERPGKALGSGDYKTLRLLAVKGPMTHEEIARQRNGYGRRFLDEMADAGYLERVEDEAGTKYRLAPAGHVALIARFSGAYRAPSHSGRPTLSAGERSILEFLNADPTGLYSGPCRVSALVKFSGYTLEALDNLLRYGYAALEAGGVLPTAPLLVKITDAGKQALNCASSQEKPALAVGRKPFSLIEDAAREIRSEVWEASVALYDLRSWLESKTPPTPAESLALVREAEEHLRKLND
jgi:hypothetical protein